MTRAFEPGHGSLAAIVESSADAIIGLTLSGIVTSWNPSAERLYGYSAAEMLGERSLRIVPPELHNVEQRLIDKVAEGARIDSLDTSRLRRDGGRLIVSLSMFPITDGEQRPIAIAAIERDVTNHRALEAQLLQAKRMEAVGRLAGGVAQEFNNINTAILGFVDFVAQRLPQGDASRSDLDAIAEQAMRGSRLARHLLAFSARKAQGTHSVSVDELLRSMEPLLQRLVSERVWLTLDLADGGARVHADESQLELVIFELVINGSDAIGDRGTMTLSTQRRVVDDTDMSSPPGVPTGHYVEIVVRDSGAGMSAATRALAFHPFYTTKADGGHIGLGLAMVYGIVHQLGGYLSVSEASPSGTDVRVLLPAAPAGESERGAPATSAHDVRGNETVLVVEDEDAVRAVVTRALRANGYEVVEAKNGEDALVVAGDYAAPIHLVVSDVIMPHMDGRTLFEHLCGWYPGIRFLFISGYTRGMVTRDEFKGEATEFLAKPFTVEQLGTTVRQLLDRPRSERGE